MPDSTYNPRVSISDDLLPIWELRLAEEIRQGLQGKKPLDDNVEAWNNLYEGVRATKSTPWPGCSNLHLPLAAAQIDTLRAQLCQTVTGTTPYWRIEGMEESDEAEGRARAWERWLQFCADQRLGLKGKIGEIGLGTLKHGTAIAKLYWDRSERRVREMVPKGKARRVVNRVWQFVKETLLGQYTGKDQQAYEIREKIYQEGRPRLDYVPLRDWVMFPAESRSITDAVLVGDRRTVRLPEIKAKERLGVFEKGTAEKLKEMAGVQPTQTETLDAQGIEVSISAEVKPYDQWEVIRSLPLRKVKNKYVLDEENGEERDCLITLVMTGGRPALIARCILYPWFHGRRHYIPFRVLGRDGDFYGRSICALLTDINDALDTLHNQDTDYFTLLVNRPILLEKGVNVTNRRGETTIEFGPGATIWVQSGQLSQIQFMQMPGSPPDVPVRKRDLIDFSERVTSVTEAKMGRRQGGDTTLGEIEITESQGNVRLEDMIATFQGVTDYEEGSGLKELAYQLMGLTIQFEDSEQTIRVLGEDGPLQETVTLPQDLEEALGMYDYVPQGNSYTSNQGQRRAQALMLYNTLMQNPLVIQDMQRVHAVTKELLTAYGEVNWKALIGDEAQAEQLAQQQAAAQAQAMGGVAPGMEGAESPEAQGMIPTGSPEGEIDPEAEGYIPAGEPEEEMMGVGY